MTQINAIHAPLMTPLVPGGAQVPQMPAQPPMIPHNLTNQAQAQLHGTRQVNAQPLHQAAGQVAPNQEGFLAKVGRWFREGSAQNAGLPPTVSVPMPGGGPNVTFRCEELAPMIKSLPRMLRADARANLVTTLADRLQTGQTLLNRIHNANPVGRPNASDVANLMLFISTSAKASGADFADGAFSVDDAQGRLANYFYGCPETYQRSSSHMESMQDQVVNGHRNTHRGIDIPQGTGGLPHGHATLLFCGIPGNNQEPARLFLKMESHGCRLNTMHDVHRDHGAQNDRPWKGSDIPEAIGHAFSFLNTRGAGDATGSRKERIPGNVKKEFETLTSAYQGSPHHALLTHGTPLDNGAGIKVIMANLQQLSAAVAHDPAQLADFTQKTVGIRTALSHLAEVNDMNVRIGNEVTRTLDDLLNVTAHPAQTQAEKLTVISALFNIVA